MVMYRTIKRSFRGTKRLNKSKLPAPHVGLTLPEAIQGHQYVNEELGGLVTEETSRDAARRIQAREAARSRFKGRRPKVVGPKVDKRSRSTLDDWLEGGEWTLVKSSNVAAIRFDLGQQKLWVAFKGGGVYVYSEVSTWAAKEMYTASSMGKYVWAKLRGIYPYARVS